jgi:gamma-glutamylcyclotransferase (GGCT)/AIG2-like uncharacterized protein YtfP
VPVPAWLILLHYDVLYFAYGSNLDADNWVQWCEVNGYDPGSIELIGRAWLPDYEPVFHYQSRLRKGGALDVRPRRGTATPGALFRVRDWTGLDAKEGLSGAYNRRLEVTALTDDGRGHAAVTYCVCDERLGSFVAPESEYQEIVTRGLSRFGHGHDQFSAAARGESSPSISNAIFAYGTLMRGQRSHDLVASRLRRLHNPARVTSASLVRIDWYPGLVLSAEGVVHGELLELDDVGAALCELDPYEDFAGYGDADSLYRRSFVRAHTNGGAVLAWTYVFLGGADGFPVIESGRWSDA